MVGLLALEDSDLAFLIRTLMPECKDFQRMMKTLREDEEILEAMLLDDKLLGFLRDNPDFIIQVSPRLFFTVLINRVRHDLMHRSYTVERDERHPVVVFDSDEVAGFLDQSDMRSYLADMLTSFIRINTLIIPVRVGKGIWRKLRISDFDVDSLINYSQSLEESRRFFAYKRIADVCLFMAGVFSDYLRGSLDGALRRRLPASGRGREGYEREGRHFYRAAAGQKTARLQDMDRVLSDLSEDFGLAVKSLAFLADNYLGLTGEQMFLQ